MADTGVVDWRGCEAFFTGRDAGREDALCKCYQSRIEFKFCSWRIKKVSPQNERLPQSIFSVIVNPYTNIDNCI